MAWSTIFGPDAYTATQYTALPTYNAAAYAQNTSDGTWRISTNGTSAGCTVSTSARCYYIGSVGDDQAGEYTVTGSSVDRNWGICLRFTDGDSGNFWGGTGYNLQNFTDGTARVFRLDGGGTHPQLASWSYTPSSGDVFRFEVIGTQLEGKVNGVSLGTVSDATFTSGTVSLWSGASLDDFSNMSIDAFTIEEQAAAGGQPTMRRWGGIPFMGGQGIGQKGGGDGRTWGRRKSGIIVPSRFREAA